MTSAQGQQHAARVAFRRISMLKTAFGPVIASALDDDNVTEIIANPDGALWIERAGIGRERADGPMATADVERIIRLVASALDTVCDQEHPIISGELPGTGERFEGVLPPVSSNPAFTIRKPSKIVIPLDDYVAAGVMTQRQAQLLRSSVRMRSSILIAGGTASGKTTLANSLLAEIAECNERVVILEDTRELRCEAKDSIALRTSQRVTLEALVRSTMRLRPDRIIVGEVRGGEALDLMKAWNTGHPGGIATIHANSAVLALARLEQLIGERSQSASQSLIAEAVDVVAFIEKTQEGRRVTEIIRVTGHDRQQGYMLEPADAPELFIVNNGDHS